MFLPLLTSTVMLDPPDMAAAVGQIYTTATPLFNSIWPIVLFIAAFIFIGAIVSAIFAGISRLMGNH